MAGYMNLKTRVQVNAEKISCMLKKSIHLIANSEEESMSVANTSSQVR